LIQDSRSDVWGGDEDMAADGNDNEEVDIQELIVSIVSVAMQNFFGMSAPGSLLTTTRRNIKEL